METLYERCAGLDIGKDEVVAAIRTPDGAGGRRMAVRTFGTFTARLEALADWLADEGVSAVVMEATGQYWKPVWYALEERGFELLLVNARHVRILPGRKTDVKDAEWLAELLEHGLLRGSFVPPAAIRELRDLTRYRKRLIQTHASEAQRIAKTLEDAGIRLGSVASDILGVSGRAMLTALVAGEREPDVLAALARGRLGTKRAALREALHGRFSAHHALLIRLALEHIEHLDRSIETLDGEVDRAMAPFLWWDPASSAWVRVGWTARPSTSDASHRSPGSRWSARSGARTNDRDAGEERRRLGPTERYQAHPIGMPPGRLTMRDGARGSPCLIWVRGSWLTR
jgi:transposase